MTTTSPRSARLRVLAIAGVAAALTVGVVAPAFAGSSAHHATVKTTAKKKATPPVVSGSRYLALGDSVPFGYREPTSVPKPNFAKPKTMIGYPEDIAAGLHLKVTNAACPGETSASFINTKAQSNGCENVFVKGKSTPQKGESYRTLFPLHVKYASKTESQLTYAEKFLKAHPTTRLVTLMIGANDGFICEVKYSDGCTGEIGALQKTIEKNVTTILKGLRNTAHYNGQLVVVTYYSTDYSNELTTLGSTELDTALTTAAKPYHATIADGLKAFKAQAATEKGKTCTAGLLTVLSPLTSPPTCGVHLSPAGAAVLAQAIEKVIKE
jgi:lysophospholipase L1-like esterase